MISLPQAAREFIERGKLAHLVTNNRDGSPQVSIVWTGLDGDELFMVHLGGYRYQKLRNIERDARVAVSLEGDGIDDHGVTPYLVVYGTARVEEGDIAHLLERLARAYMGERAERLRGVGDEPGYITRIAPERISGIGPWMEAG